ncbi:hypothetical protein LINGRAHAP2_LOCUS26101 [Linum grandiflorum]
MAPQGGAFLRLLRPIRSSRRPRRRLRGRHLPPFRRPGDVLEPSDLQSSPGAAAVKRGRCFVVDYRVRVSLLEFVHY